jgi:hypothetical protein
MKKLILALVLGAALTACASEQSKVIPAQLDYSSWGKIAIDTQDLRVINRTTATPQKPPYVGYQFQPTLADAVQRWAADRLQATGSAGHATLIIKDANVTEQKLPLEGGMDSWFTRQQAKKYVGHIEVEIEAQTPADNATGMASAHATHTVSVPEKATETEKYEAYHTLLDALMRDLNQNLEQAMHTYMTRFLTSQPQQGGDAMPAPAAAPAPDVIVEPPAASTGAPTGLLPSRRAN